MKILISASILLVMFGNAAVAQKKPWTEWTKKDVEKTLNDSAWGQTQSEGGQQAQPQNVSAITQTTAARRDDRTTSDTRTESDQAKPSNQEKYHVRFLSAKPVRAASARMDFLAQTESNEALT